MGIVFSPILTSPQAGCDALLSCNKQIELRSSVEDHNVCHCVLDAMNKHGEDPSLPRWKGYGHTGLSLFNRLVD